MVDMANILPNQAQPQFAFTLEGTQHTFSELSMSYLNSLITAHNWYCQDPVRVYICLHHHLWSHCTHLGRLPIIIRSLSEANCLSPGGGWTWPIPHEDLHLPHANNFASTLCLTQRDFWILLWPKFMDTAPYILLPANFQWNYTPACSSYTGDLHSSLSTQYLCFSMNLRAWGKKDNIYSHLNRTCHTVGDASVGTSTTVFIKTTNKHLSEVLSDDIKGCIKHCPYATNPWVSKPKDNRWPCDCWLAREYLCHLGSILPYVH